MHRRAKFHALGGFTIEIEQGGGVSVEGRHYELTGLESLLRSDGNPAKTQVTIAADKNVPFQDFVHVMDICQEAGVGDIGIAATPAR